ncbi:MAG: hypothetical protein ACI4IJ_01320 [Acutalibacteraceae bacterium]|nr:hypothetical protein [Bacillota bacterium]
MGKKILKSIAVIAVTFAFSFLLGVACFGRQYYSIMPFNARENCTLGFILIVIASLITLTTSVFILKYFIFFTKTQVLDAKGNTLSDNSSIRIGSTNVKPIVAASVTAMLGVVFFGFGFGMMFREIVVYTFYLAAIALIFLAIGLIFFLFSIIHHKIRRRFAWVTSGVCAIFAAIVIFNMIPALCDINVTEKELTAVTGTISSVASDSGVVSGPGKTEVVIKGTSGETIILRYSGDTNDLAVGSRYTFYYLPNTRLIDKIAHAENINIDSETHPLTTSDKNK